MATDLTLGTLHIQATSNGRSVAIRYSPKRGRKVFVCGLMDDCRIDFGLGESRPCIWLGPVAFDLSRAEAERAVGCFPKMRQNGVRRALKPVPASAAPLVSNGPEHFCIGCGFKHNSNYPNCVWLKDIG